MLNKKITGITKDPEENIEENQLPSEIGGPFPTENKNNDDTIF